VAFGLIDHSRSSGDEGGYEMARKNRYTGVLKPLPLGKGSPEVSLVLIYDIENDRLRTRASEVCLNYGLERIQFSAFFGKLNRNRRQELALRLQRELGDESGRIRIIPVCEQDLKDMWVLDQYRRDADELKAKADRERPRLRVLASED
jgi:CRISPR-associated protein Cas2